MSSDMNKPMAEISKKIVENIIEMDKKKAEIKSLMNSNIKLMDQFFEQKELLNTGQVTFEIDHIKKISDSTVEVFGDVVGDDDYKCTDCGSTKGGRYFDDNIPYCEKCMIKKDKKAKKNICVICEKPAPWLTGDGWLCDDCHEDGE